MSSSTIYVDKTIFDPFRYRFRPFIAGRDIGKMLLLRAFRASAPENTINKWRKWPKWS